MIIFIGASSKENEVARHPQYDGTCFFAVLTNSNPASSQFQRDQWGTWVAGSGNDVLMLKKQS